MIDEHDYFIIKETLNDGRGLYARNDIPKGTIIHTCEIIVLTAYETKQADIHGILKCHRYPYSRFQDAVLLGHGSLFNGLDVDFNVDDELVFVDHRPMVRFTTVRDILKGEQLYIQYNGKEEIYEPAY